MKKRLVVESVGERKLKAASFSIGVNFFLIALKLGVAIITGSLAILAELAHSVFDLLASVFAYIGIKKAEEPADKTHPYGHEKFENLSSLAQTLLIVITSILVVYESINRIFSPKKIESTELGLLVMVFTIAIDYFISKYLHKASDEYGSSALEADAYHFTTDLWGAIAVIVGLFFVMLGFPIFDSVAAIAVAVMMLWISYHLGRKSLDALMDKSPSESLVERVGVIVSKTPGVEHFHKLKARKAGNKVFVELHIHVAPDMTVYKSHKIAHRIKENVINEFPETKEVTVHVEPDARDKKMRK